MQITNNEATSGKNLEIAYNGDLNPVVKNE